MTRVQELEQSVHNGTETAKVKVESKARRAIEFAKQSQRLAQYTLEQENETTGSTQAIEAKFITAQDPVVITSDGGRLPAVPLDEAVKLNRLKDEVEGVPEHNDPMRYPSREGKDGTVHGLRSPEEVPSKQEQQASETDAPLGQAIPPSRTNPLFPPLPMWGPPSPLRNLQSYAFRTSSSVLSLCFLGVIILGAFFTSIPTLVRKISIRLKFQNPAKQRPFYAEERRRADERRQAERNWKSRNWSQKSVKGKRSVSNDEEQDGEKFEQTASHGEEHFIPTEGGPDPLICDVGYYARRVGLDSETFLVQTEDGFIIELWHIFNPLLYKSRPSGERGPQSPDLFESPPSHTKEPGRKYPVLLIHGLLQSSGAYCCTDDNSLAFYLAKSGLDVWLGNNRCGFKPRHTLLEPTDARMWAWNIRQMGVMDLPALMSRVLQETGFSKLALVAHSQGTTQTMVALAKEQRPEIGDKLSVVCLLAPAAYAGPLIGKMYFKFMRLISPGMFRAMFGIHAFIPFMMKMHRCLPGEFYGFMGYRVFSFLFNWTDLRWDSELRDRCFQFAPVYVSAESMRWWLGRECFAKQKCILSTKQESLMENREDEESDKEGNGRLNGHLPRRHNHQNRGRFAWYDEHCPPLALWVCGSDDLVDGRRLLNRFERGREPHVEIVHSEIIEEYEHLDVIWAVDSIEKVGRGVLETIWKTVPEEYRDHCKIPIGCEEIKIWKGRDRRRKTMVVEVDGENTTAGAEREPGGDFIHTIR
jgi:pimeloyl-ACP methyl ester carboxylesterase